ncbi:MAG: nucleotide pyrophosphohydrolase [Clostridia bacterium]|nr:nucleotide pyrophosphohydrolase [Clostridia bacterium]
MQSIQRELQEKYRDKWEPVDPAHGRNKLLWMLAEIGEVTQIIKKKGDGSIMQTPEVRHDFIEELCDVMMYLNDVCLCYGITPEEVEVIYRAKHERNMHRW